MEMSYKQEQINSEDLFEEREVKIEYESDSGWNQTRMHNETTVKIECDSDSCLNPTRLHKEDNISTESAIKMECDPVNNPSMLQIEYEYEVSTVKIEYSKFDVNHNKKQKRLPKKKSTSSQVKPYMCDVCNKAFKYPSNFKRHKEVHDNKTIFKCAKCSYTTSYKSLWSKHLHLHVRTHKCDVCDKLFKRRSNLKKHQDVHNGLVRCSVCKGVFPSKKLLIEHQSVHPKLKCDMCDYFTVKKKTLIYHISTHSQDKSYECHTCNLTFKSNWDLTGHKKLHKASVICLVCNREFPNKKMLNEHKRLYACPECQETFHDEKILAEHMSNPDHLKCAEKLSEESHKKKTRCSPYKSYQCDDCDKTFKLPCLLKRHKLTHKKPLMFQCDQCPYKTHHQNHWNNHVRRHSIVFKCEICDKVAKTPSALKKHSVMHRGIIRCHVCRMEFADRNQLDEHKANHARLKCDMCPYTTIRKYDLITHFASHSEVRNFGCEVCGKLFKTSLVLKKHKCIHRV